MSLQRWENGGKLISRISDSIKEERVSHAYIFEGDTTINKIEFAKDFLKAVNCQVKPGMGCDRCISCKKIDHDNCEDLYIVESDGKSVKDAFISRIQDLLSKKPYGPRNMVIISDADSMTIRAQNRLLKNLEEPKGSSITILLSTNQENLLQTIRSRCVAYNISCLYNGTDKTNESMYEAANKILNLAFEGEKNIYIRKLLAKTVKSKEEAMEILDMFESVFRNILLAKDERCRFVNKSQSINGVHLIEEARRDLIYNVKYQNVLKNLMIKIGG